MQTNITLPQHRAGERGVRVRVASECAVVHASGEHRLCEVNMQLSTLVENTVSVRSTYLNSGISTFRQQQQINLTPQPTCSGIPRMKQAHLVKREIGLARKAAHPLGLAVIVVHPGEIRLVIGKHLGWGVGKKQ